EWLSSNEHDCDLQFTRRRIIGTETMMLRATSKGFVYALASMLVVVSPTGLLLPATAESPEALGCFTRTYDRAHLARHPDQLVTAVMLRVYRPPPDTASPYWFLAQ